MFVVGLFVVFVVLLFVVFLVVVFVFLFVSRVLLLLFCSLCLLVIVRWFWPMLVCEPSLCCRCVCCFVCWPLSVSCCSWPVPQLRNAGSLERFFFVFAATARKQSNSKLRRNTYKQYYHGHAL